MPSSCPVVHQSGKDRRRRSRRDRYAAHGLTADVRAFLDDVPGDLARADLVVGRSGAGMVAEVAAVGRAAVFVPFPFAADDHQRSNAEALVLAGGAVCVVERDETRSLASRRRLARYSRIRRSAEVGDGRASRDAGQPARPRWTSPATSCRIAKAFPRAVVTWVRAIVEAI